MREDISAGRGALALMAQAGQAQAQAHNTLQNAFLSAQQSVGNAMSGIHALGQQALAKEQFNEQMQANMRESAKQQAQFDSTLTQRAKELEQQKALRAQELQQNYQQHRERLAQGAAQFNKQFKLDTIRTKAQAAYTGSLTRGNQIQQFEWGKTAGTSNDPKDIKASKVAQKPMLGDFEQNKPALGVKGSLLPVVPLQQPKPSYAHFGDPFTRN
ncbi:hypothetical protein [Helicobacter ailurogastricus]|uniref:hypothetical protein n=1 Tax=Helicobacter ailurogastricus TaxID=1578720 RepID=UPI0022C42247|nr:hypothetical protein [Helicobacter ailurogastricus]GLH58374.1 hypothetical protein NHP214376_11650 [Helicobacter ailurogastricus]GLH59512.1 hypothetical protein NHP214377_07800 [Helicobacter ailurogastricus]GMB90781.1 hypothetical protein NHP190002_15050 [Helicobacter ailurogastricus]